MNRPRLLLAAKTALAVGISWALAPHLPGAVNNYPYYAPLGALLSIYPTLMGSLKSGAQTLLGLLTGIALATLVVATVGPNWWSIPAIVGVGVVLSGTGWFGAGREYVPTAALFVLIIGGNQADQYALGYLAQMGFGIAIGIVVNIVIAPQVTSAAAAAKIDAFQGSLADQLRNIGEALRESWPPEHAAWARNTDQLEQTAESVRQALVEADESRRGNPRALLHCRDTRTDHARLETLNHIVFHIRDISGALADTVWERPGALSFDPELAAPMSAACHAIAAAIEQHGNQDAAAHRVLGKATRALRQLAEAVDQRTTEQGQAMGPGVLTAMHLRRILMSLNTHS